MILLPAASSRKSVSRFFGTNVPDGARTCIFIPACALSHSQFDAYPSAVRFTVTVSGSPVCGDEHSE